MPKKKLRRLLLDERKALSERECGEKSFSIQQKLIDSEEYGKAGVIALYCAIHNEVSTARITADALFSGKRVFFPVMCDGNLVFREYTEASTMRAGAFGILEPSSSNPVLNADQVDMIVIPGIAFDLKGNRIGYGKGCYDKALHHLEGRGRLVALCYDFQLVESISGEPHDVKVDVIITEERIVHP